jgi:hypothetical protein
MTRPSATILFLSCAAFAIAGALCRLIFVSVHTRFQIAAFCAAAVLLQLAAPAWFRRSPGGAARYAYVWNAAAATFAILATRVALEGVPEKVLTVLGAIRA